MAYLEADVEEELDIELPETTVTRSIRGGLVRNAVYGLVHGGLLWSETFAVKLAKEGFKQSRVDLCVFRRVLHGKTVVIIVVYVDDLLAASITKRNKKQAMEDFRSCFPNKALGEVGFTLDTTSRGIVTLGCWNSIAAATCIPWLRCLASKKRAPPRRRRE